MLAYSTVALVVAAGAPLTGCGHTRTATSSEASAGAAVKSTAPAYRVGQFCFAQRKPQYRAAGFTCYRKHLRKR